ncbi:MAG: hypothetical protein Q8R91_03115 [Candidatus Omnitrophota bacterium]|nr:hypothetical protein [Candidatus Omnitrophota bacterium]
MGTPRPISWRMRLALLVVPTVLVLLGGELGARAYFFAVAQGRTR